MNKRQMKKPVKERAGSGKRTSAPKGSPHTHGSWFNILFCFFGFFVLLLFQVDFIGAFISQAEPSLSTTVALAISILYTVSFLAVLAGGFVFNSVSKFVGTLPENSLYMKADNFIDWILWWAIPVLAVLGYLLNVAIVEIFL